MTTDTNTPTSRNMGRKKKIMVYAASFLCFGFLRFLHTTLRYRIINEKFRTQADPKGNGALALAAWHQNTLMSLTSHRMQGFAVMISSSADGEIAANVTHWTGMKTARGSSSQGGRAALEELVERARRGKRVAFTVDGPKGPEKIVKLGIIKLASETGVPILPFLPIAARYWALNSWDKLRIPKPFSEIRVIYGPPLFVPKQADFEKYCLLLKNRLDDLDRVATIQS